MEQEIINAIGTLGFPIVACIYMAWLHNDAEKRHGDERAKMTEAITRMNTMLEHISRILEKDENKNA